jgi:hypothetical protein
VKGSTGGVIGWVVATLATAACLLPFSAHATPTFLSAVNVSDAGQDAFEPQVVVDQTGNVLMVWTRFDGSNLRIQARVRAPDGTFGSTATISDAGSDSSEPAVAFDPSGNAIAVWTQFDGSKRRVHTAFRPAGGSFGADQMISASGGDASQPQISFDSTGDAVAVWYRFDGAFDRIQASVRPASGNFGGVQTLSAPGMEAFEPRVAAGPNVDANAAVVWTGSDGVNTRVQAARRRDVVGFARPKGATPTYTSLVPAYQPCTVPNRSHGAPLSFSSCAPPQMSSSVLTVGTPDANGFGSNFTGSVNYTVVPTNLLNEIEEADIKLDVSMTDIRNKPSGTDYVGRVLVSADLRITDQNNAAETPETGTVQTFKYEFPVDCTATGATNIGSTCVVHTTADAVIPSSVIENKRTVWDLGQVTVKDAGPNGTGYASCPPTCGDGDETTFLRQGVFVP